MTPRILGLAALWGACAALGIASVVNVFLHHGSLPNPLIDEHAHLAYAHYLIDTHRWWPDFNHFMIADTSSNYLNHPPMFYWLMKLISSVLPNPSLTLFRASAFILYMAGMVMYWRMGARILSNISGILLFSLFPFLLYMHLQIGFYNNDALAVLGGMLAVSASTKWLSGEQLPRAFLLMLVGVLLTSAKLTALLLISSYVVCCLWMRYKQCKQLPHYYYAIALIILAAAASPFLYFMALYGSPAPNTPGQLDKLTEWHTAHQTQPAMDLLHWLIQFFSDFADQLSVPETTFIPILLYGAATVALLARLFHKTSTLREPMAAMGMASFLATILTLTIHAIFSWQRYVEYRWLFDSLLRYYLPLIGAYALLSCDGLMRLANYGKEYHDSPRE